MKKVEAIGVLDVLYFATALNIIDEMCKNTKVKLLAIETALGGKMVTIFIHGSTSDVAEAINRVQEKVNKKFNGLCKNALMITNPHKEILKFII